MNHKTKIIGAAVLVLAGVGIWVPQLPSLFGGGAATPGSERPAETAFQELAPEPSADPAGDSGARAVEPPAAGAAQPSSDDPLARLEALLARDGGRRSEGNASRWLAGSRDEGPSETGEVLARPEDDLGRKDPVGSSRLLERMLALPAFAGAELDRARAAGERLDPLETFLADHPLSGLLIGSDRRLASFGAYTFEEGETLPGTGARVAHIEARQVVLERESGLVAVTIPPFRSRAQASTSGSASGAPTGEEVAPPPAPPVTSNDSSGGPQ